MKHGPDPGNAAENNSAAGWGLTQPFVFQGQAQSIAWISRLSKERPLTASSGVRAAGDR